MPASQLLPQSLRYGESRVFEFSIEPSRIVRRHRAPEPVADFDAALREQLASPLNFPPLELAFVPDDRIVVALDRHTPCADRIIARLWPVFEQRGVQAGDVTILQPASWNVESLPDPRAALPENVRQAMRWVIHDATDPKRASYLAASSGGERIYLARDLVDADLVLPIGAVGFDPLLGFRHASSAIFPGLSNVDALAKARGQDHAELRPDDDRPLRQLQDEVSWLLGVQFGIEILPSAAGQVAGVLCGALDSVTSAARNWLKRNWLIELPQRCEFVVAAVNTEPNQLPWEQIGAALHAAKNLVQRGGKIVLLSSLSADPTEGFDYLMQSESPRDALKTLRLESPPDLIPVSRLASATDWATVYCLSELSTVVVESLFMTPLASAAEAARLLDRGGSCVFLEGAPHTFGCIT